MPISIEIFKKELNLRHQGRCPFCAEHVPLEGFRNDRSRKEFKISGLCQECQDIAFKSAVATHKMELNT